MDTTLTDPLAGALLDGRYRVQARLARGGMATVYTALDVRLDRVVAVKVMHPALADDEEFVARFIREAHAAARLSHPNVVSVYDQSVYRSPGHAAVVFLVMEYVAGRTLRDLLRERGRLSAVQALGVLEPVLGALAAAHGAGLVHRDVKPENVLLADDGRVKVADFGLARAIEASNLTATAGLLIGTVAYLAPEQVERGTADARADVYAAGILLYELLTGGPPYAGDTPLAVAYRHVHEDVPAPSARVSDVPPALDALVAAATRRDPSTRPADAGVLLTAVRAARRALPTGGTDPGSWTAADTTVLRQAPSAPTLVVPRSAGPAAGRTGRRGTVTGASATPPPRRRRRWLARVAVLLVLLAALGAGLEGWWLGSGRYISAPSVTGLARSAAVSRLQAAGLRIRWGQPVFRDDVARGLVAAADPAAGQRVRRGGTVTLGLSNGPLTARVPQLTGVDLGAARAALARLRLGADPGPAEWSDTLPSGRVIRTVPAAGSTVRHDTRVTVVLSRGRQPVPVPDVRNLPVAQATGALRRAGLGVTTSESYDDTVPAGSVVRQSVAGGSTALRGTTVTLAVSRGPQLFAVPKVVGKSVGRARAILTAAGFTVEVRSLPFGPGEVLAQSLAPGSMQPRGTTVTLSVF